MSKSELELKTEWMKEAREMEMDTLPAFLKRLSEHRHDYGTICHAIAAAAVGAAWALENSPAGGITGFQASCVMWDFITGWMSTYEGKPLKLVDYSNMLYPQYEEKFSKAISQDAWDYLQKHAAKNIAIEKKADHAVIEHWKRIASGEVPFGYRVIHE